MESKIVNFSLIPTNQIFKLIQGRLDLIGIDLDKTQFDSCTIKNAVFDDATFLGAEFSDVKLSNISFSSSDFRGATIFDVEVLDNVTLDNCDFRNAQITNLKGLNDESVHVPFKYTAPNYFRILAATISNFFRGGYNAGKHTIFENVDTKNLTDSFTKELKEYINWYQHLMTQINRLNERSIWNRISLFLGILLTKYWSSFWVLSFWALSANAIVATVISIYPQFYVFKHGNLVSWNWFDAFYYCIVTFTTLGYGDVTPSSIPAQCAAGVVAIAGYVTLGILIYLIARKVDRKF